MGKRSREKKEKRERGEMGFKIEKSETGLVAILWGVILVGTCLILFTPLIISPKYFFPFVGPKSIYFIALVEIIFAAWLILIISVPKYRPRFNALLLVLILFLIIFIVSSVFGADFSRSFWSKHERMTGLLMQFHLFVFFLVLLSVFQKKEDWLKIFGVSVFAAILMSIISLIPKIGMNVLGAMAFAARGGATIGNSSFLGTYLLFNFFLALYLYFNSKNVLRIFSIFGLVVISIALLLSTARAAILSTLIGLVLLFLLWLIFCHKGKLKLIGISFLVILVIIGITLSFFITQPDSFIYKVIFEKSIGKTFGGRFVVWQGAWKGFLEKPFFGWGPENFELVFTKYFNPCMFAAESGCGTDIWYDRAHNIIFDTLVTVGIFGFLSYLSIFIVAFYILWKKFFQQYINFWTAGIFSVVLISYSIQNLTVFDMVNSYMLFFLILGFIGNLSFKKEDIIGEKKSFNLIMLIMILVLFIFTFSKFIIQPLRADRYVINALNFPPGAQERLNFYKKTLETSPIGKYQIRDFFAQSTLESTYSKEIEKVSLDSLKKEFDFINEELEKSTKESPLDFRSHLKLGQTYNTYTVLTNISKLDRADEVLKRAIELSPTNQQGYWALAQTKIYQGKINEALSLAEKALNIELRAKQSHLIVIQIAKIMGDYDLAQKKAEEAIKINPSWEPDIKKLLE